MRGRKPKPTELHKLHGTHHTTKHGGRAQTEPKPVGTLETPPEWLSESQKAGWRYVIEHAPPNVLKMIDATVLCVWVEAEDRHRNACMKQAQMPLLWPVTGSIPVASPYLAIIHKCALLIVKAASELGFSPASRPRIDVSGLGAIPRDDSPWKKLRLMQGGKA